jgi:outer membrane biosynthesis protein TonB
MVRRYLSYGILIPLIFVFCFSCVVFSEAQTKPRKIKRPAYSKQQKQKTNPASAFSEQDVASCLATSNEPKPTVNKHTDKTEQGYLVSDCAPTVLHYTNRPQATYPKLAKAANASGAVKIDTVINGEGRVIWAQAIEGHPLLRGAAQRAACQTRVKPLVDCRGHILTFNAVMSYNFVIDK